MQKERSLSEGFQVFLPSRRIGWDRDGHSRWR
jgi:hypothetical protein